MIMGTNYQLVEEKNGPKSGAAMAALAAVAPSPLSRKSNHCLECKAGSGTPLYLMMQKR